MQWSRKAWRFVFVFWSLIALAYPGNNCADGCLAYNSKTTKPPTFTFCDNIWQPEVQQNSFSDNTNGLRYTRIVISNPSNTQMFISLFSAPHGGASPEQLELSFTPFLVVSKPEVASNFHIPSETHLFGLTITKLIRQKQNIPLFIMTCGTLCCSSCCLSIWLCQQRIACHCQVHILRMIVKLSQKYLLSWILS